MFRNVRLTRAPIARLSLLIPCFQFFCVSPFISKRLPAESGSRTGLTAKSVLCLNTSVRCSPRLNDAITGRGPSSGSSSLCMPILSRLSRYKFRRTLLKRSSATPSTWLLICSSRGVQAVGARLIPEYLYECPASPYQAMSRGCLWRLPHTTTSSSSHGVFAISVASSELADAGSGTL